MTAGPEEEIALLMRRWEQVKAGDGAVGLIGGEPGNREIAPRAAAHRMAEARRIVANQSSRSNGGLQPRGRSRCRVCIYKRRREVFGWKCLDGVWGLRGGSPSAAPMVIVPFGCGLPKKFAGGADRSSTTSRSVTGRLSFDAYS